ncbi:MAG: cation diffusion facilitator family transporter [Bacteroidales bacterium]|jgi:cobalt-zinc-cadmium efflux system protein|nr:cation transporter [Bacteroidales bacterium]
MKHHSHHQHTKHISLNKAFIIGILLNVLFVIVEFTAGIYYDSMGLLSDAGHNLSDIASLLLAMLAFRLSKLSAKKNYTYGYKKSTVLVSLSNAVILLIAVGFIIAESINKLYHPKTVEGNVIAWVAGVGIIINLFTALLFLKKKDEDLNIKGAYLHMMADTLVSLGVVASGVLILFTGWYIIDPIIGIGIACVIMISTWNLLKDSILLSLDGVPTTIDIEEIKKIILAEKQIINIHHLHIWALSTTENALTVHIILEDMKDMEIVKQNVKQKLAKIGITHATLEFEKQESNCIQQCI